MPASSQLRVGDSGPRELGGEPSRVRIAWSRVPPPPVRACVSRFYVAVRHHHAAAGRVLGMCSNTQAILVPPVVSVLELALADHCRGNHVAERPEWSPNYRREPVEQGDDLGHFGIIEPLTRPDRLEPSPPSFRRGAVHVASGKNGDHYVRRNARRSAGRQNRNTVVLQLPSAALPSGPARRALEHLEGSAAIAPSSSPPVNKAS